MRGSEGTRDLVIKRWRFPQRAHFLTAKLGFGTIIHSPNTSFVHDFRVRRGMAMKLKYKVRTAEGEEERTFSYIPLFLGEI